MNLQFPPVTPARVRQIAFAGKLPRPELLADSVQAAKSHAKKNAPTGTGSLVYKWVRLNLGLIRDGLRESRAEQRQAKLLAREVKSKTLKH